MRKAIHFSWQLTGMVLAVLWLFQTPLWATIYKWKDDRGKVHFTDDKSKIPLKYRDQFEKFKGVVEPSPKNRPGPSTGGGGGSGAGETEASQEETGGESGDSEKAPEKSKYTKEQIALLKKVRQYLARERATRIKLINKIEPTKLNGKYYLAVGNKSAPKKKAMAKQIGQSPIPSLVETKKFLKKSRVEYVKLSMGSLEMMDKVRRIKQIVEGEIPTQTGLLEKINADIGPEDDPPPAE